MCLSLHQGAQLSVKQRVYFLHQLGYRRGLLELFFAAVVEAHVNETMSPSWECPVLAEFVHRLSVLAPKDRILDTHDQVDRDWYRKHHKKSNMAGLASVYAKPLLKRTNGEDWRSVADHCYHIVDNTTGPDDGFFWMPFDGWDTVATGLFGTKHARHTVPAGFRCHIPEVQCSGYICGELSVRSNG